MQKTRPNVSLFNRVDIWQVLGKWEVNHILVMQSQQRNQTPHKFRLLSAYYSLNTSWVLVDSSFWGHLKVLSPVEHNGNIEYVYIPVSPSSPTIRAPIYKCYFTYIVLQALVVLAPDSIDQAEMSGEWRICQKSELTTYQAYHFV